MLPNEHHYKVTDTITSAIILSGTWLSPCSSDETLANIVKDPQISGPYWETDSDRAWAEYLTIRYTQRRRDAFFSRNGQLFAITHLAVDPADQNQGAGSLFMQCGVQQADRLGLECVVESSVRAEGFYKS